MSLTFIVLYLLFFSNLDFCSLKSQCMQADLDAYLPHPAHVAAKAIFAPLFADKFILDLEIPAVSSASL